MTATPAESPQRESAARGLPWLSHRPFVALTYAVLFAGGALVVASALPSVARALGWSEVRTVSRTSLRTTSAEQAGLDAMHEKERSLGDDDDDADPRLTARAAIVRAKTQVFEVPGKAALGTLAPGDLVRVLGERDGYFHVLYEDQGDAEIGWVKKADLMLRDPNAPPADRAPSAQRRR